jgi:HAD superfamily hydrolase (TIGR01509 family)
MDQVAPFIAEALKRRTSMTLPLITVAVCENGLVGGKISPADHLSAILKRLVGPGLYQVACFPQIVVDCSIPALPENPSDIIHREGGKLWVEQSPVSYFRSTQTEMIQLTSNIETIQRQKLFCYNTLHCYLSVIGWLTGQDHIDQVARARGLSPIVDEIAKNLSEAVNVASSISSTAQPSTDYAAAAISRMQRPVASTFDPISRSLKKLQSGWYFRDGRITGPLIALGLMERPWQCPLLVHMLSLCLFAYLRPIDVFRNGLPFVTPSSTFSIDDGSCPSSVDLSSAIATIFGPDSSKLPIMEPIAEDMDFLYASLENGRLSLRDMVGFLRRPIKERLTLAPRSLSDVRLRCVTYALHEGLVATEQLLFQVTRDLIKDYSSRGLTIEQDQYAAHVGTSEGEFFAIMKRDFDIRDVPVASLVQERQKRFIDELKKMDPDHLIKPGVRKMLRMLSGRGIELSVYSNASRERVDATLDHTSLASYFSVVRSASDPGMVPKPDPSMLRSILEELRIRPEECLVIESSRTGVLAAANAGCFCFFIVNAYSVPELAKRRGVVSLSNSLELLTRLRRHLARNGKVP